MQEPYGAIKIKDGLFIGDIYAARDLAFIVNNKVTHIVNCSSTQIPNHWEPIGISYLSFPWQESPSQLILCPSMTSFYLFYSYIEQALNSGSSVLVHCVKGTGRSTLVIISYLMKRFSWNLLKTFQFLNYKGVNLNIGKQFLKQAKSFEDALIKTHQISKSNKWAGTTKDSDEELLRNTLINTFIPQETGAFTERNTKSKRISWAEPDEKAEVPESTSKVTLRLPSKSHHKGKLQPLTSRKLARGAFFTSSRNKFCKSSTYNSLLFK